MFAGRSHCDSGDIRYLICHATLQDNVIKASCDFMEGSSSFYITTPSGLVDTSILVSEDMFLTYHVTSRDHVFKEFCDFMERSFS